MNDSSLSWLVLGAASALAIAGSQACGGGVTVQDAQSTTAGAGGGGQGSGPATTGKGSAQTAGPTTSSSGAGGASMDPCQGLAESACIAIFPQCAPVYDDLCCSSCNPGPCSDCVDYAFHHCEERGTACPPSKPSCGFAPDWACSGGEAVCGFQGKCTAVPGCVQGVCSPDVGCACIPEQDCTCLAVTAESCAPPLCNAIPPACPPGMVAESDGSCWTGYCLPAAVCG